MLKLPLVSPSSSSDTELPNEIVKPVDKSAILELNSAEQPLVELCTKQANGYCMQINKQQFNLNLNTMASWHIKRIWRIFTT